MGGIGRHKFEYQLSGPNGLETTSAFALLSAWRKLGLLCPAVSVPTCHDSDYILGKKQRPLLETEAA